MTEAEYAKLILAFFAGVGVVAYSRFVHEWVARLREKDRRGR